MKAGVGLVALLLALVIVGVVMLKQMNAATRPAIAAGPDGSLPVAPGASGSVPSRAIQLQNEAREGVAKAITDAQVHRDQAEKP